MQFKSAALIVNLLFSIGNQSATAAPVCIKDSKYAKQLNLPIYEWVDRTKKRKGTIVAVHGLTLYAMAWDQMAKHLAANGYHVFAMDIRGFGRWRKDGTTFGGNEKIEIGQSQQDLLDLVTDLRQAHPTDKLFGLGESMGSNMILALFSEHPELGDGAILGSPCYKTRVHPKPMRWAEDLAKQMVRPNKLMNLEPYSAPYLTNDPVLAQACDTDPMMNRKMTPSELIKVDVMDDRAFGAAKKLPADFPILIIAGADDAMFKSNELSAAVKKFGTKDVSVTLLAGKGHLLMEHQRVHKQVAALIDGWLTHETNSGSLANAPATSANHHHGK